MLYLMNTNLYSYIYAFNTIFLAHNSITNVVKQKVIRFYVFLCFSITNSGTIRISTVCSIYVFCIFRSSQGGPSKGTLVRKRSDLGLSRNRLSPQYANRARQNMRAGFVGSRDNTITI